MNEKNVVVSATDDADDNAGAAHHEYRVAVTDNTGKVVEDVRLHFQHGPIQEIGVNGITDQALLAIVLDRWRCFQKSKWANRETAVSITKLEEALMWQHKRTLDRLDRGVEGTNKV